LEVNQAAVYDQVPDEYIGEDIVFLTISFDPENDTPEVLDNYRSYFEADGETWRMTRIPDQQELNNLLDEFGVIVIPEDNGHFTHNSAFYLVDPDGYLTDVMDYTLVDEAADRVNSILETEVGE
jgi:protein SCO1/2